MALSSALPLIIRGCPEIPFCDFCDFFPGQQIDRAVRSASGVSARIESMSQLVALSSASDLDQVQKQTPFPFLACPFLC